MKGNAKNLKIRKMNKIVTNFEAVILYPIEQLNGLDPTLDASTIIINK